MLLGYARVSTKDQDPQLQRDALRKAGVESRHIYEDTASGTKTSRPALDKLLHRAKEGDTILVWRLDRFGRSLPHLINTIKELGDRGVAFKSLNDPIDTSNASGRLVFHVLASLAEFERSLPVERTQAGLAAAKRRGAKLGRRFILDSAQAGLLKQMVAQGATPKQIAQAMGIGIATVYRYLNR